jgi:spore germination protein YaaH
MNDLHGARSRSHGPAPALFATVIAVTLLVIAPLGGGPLAAPVARAVDPGIHARVKGIAPLDHQVYGYLPYWRLDAGTVDRLNYNLISTIAFFGIGIKRDGNIDMAWRGTTAYLSANAVAVTNAAHAKGVRVVPTFQLFDSGSLPKMTAFLHSYSAQTRFINQAMALLARRSADGAGFDFEPMPDSLAPYFGNFLARFKTSLRRHFPGAPLVVATSAGASYTLLDLIEPIVDQMMVMTYNYRWSGSTITGAIAPLDSASRTVKIHMTRYLRRVVASKLIMGVPYYGYDWPVTSNVPHASVQPNPSAYGGVWSVTYASAMNYLAAHPDVVRYEDTAEGSAYFTYWDSQYQTYRQVYFEDEISAAAKYDYVIANGLAGVGIWTLDNDRGYSQMYDVLRRKFYNPVHRATVGAQVGGVTLSGGVVRVTHVERVKNNGNVPERGSLVWRIYDRTGHLLKKGSTAVVVYPGQTKKAVTTTMIGSAAGLSAGTYRLRAHFVAKTGVWAARIIGFRQPY